MFLRKSTQQKIHLYIYIWIYNISKKKNIYIYIVFPSLTAPPTIGHLQYVVNTGLSCSCRSSPQKRPRLERTSDLSQHPLRNQAGLKKIDYLTSLVRDQKWWSTLSLLLLSQNAWCGSVYCICCDAVIPQVPFGSPETALRKCQRFGDCGSKKRIGMVTL